MVRHRWRPRLPGGACDPRLASWLTEPGSLTARCQRNSRQFRVRLLHYGWGRALAEDAERAGGRRRLARVRDVVLECDGVPVIFAHTALSAEGKGRLGRWLANLGGRSLGSLLFTHPGFRRGGIEFLRLDRGHPLFRRALPHGGAADCLWARRSWHRLGGQRVLVTEVFLPAIAGLDRA